MKLSEMIDEKKFRNDMIEFFGFKDKGGTYLKEQQGDGSWHKIKKSIINDIISVLDSCRKKTLVDTIIESNQTIMIFDNKDAKEITHILNTLGISWIERVKK